MKRHRVVQPIIAPSLFAGDGRDNVPQPLGPFMPDIGNIDVLCGEAEIAGEH